MLWTPHELNICCMIWVARKSVGHRGKTEALVQFFDATLPNIALVSCINADQENIYKPWKLQWFCIEQCLNSRKHFWAGWKWNSYDSFGIWIFLTLAHWVAADLWQSHSCGKPNATKLPCGDGLNPTPVMIWGWFIIEFPTLQNITAHTKMSKSCWNSKNVLWHLESYVCLTIV